MARLLRSVLAVCLLSGSVAFAAPAPASSSKRDVSASQAGGQVPIEQFGEYIRIARDNDNNLLAGYAVYENGDQTTTKILRLAKSTDFGQSWFHQGDVFQGDTNYHDIDNAFPLVMPNGDILYAYRNHDRDLPAGKPYTYFRISISISHDGGQSFEYLATVDERTPAANNEASGIWEPFLRFDRNGNLQCYYSEENPGVTDGSMTDQDGWMRSSTDGGQTWSSNFTAVSGGDRVSRDGMIGVAPTDNNGNLMAVFETISLGQPFSVDAVLSHDDGYTWGERFNLYTAPNGHNAGAPQIYNTWGTLVTSFMSDENGSTGSGYDGGDVMVILSENGNPYGFNAPFVVANQGHWPGVFNRDSSHFMVTYSQGQHDYDGEAYTQLYQLTVS